MPRARAAAIRAFAAATVPLDGSLGLDAARAGAAPPPGRRANGPPSTSRCGRAPSGTRSPRGDLGLRHALGCGYPMPSRRAAAGFRPWRAYAAMYLLVRTRRAGRDQHIRVSSRDLRLPRSSALFGLRTAPEFGYYSGPALPGARSPALPARSPATSLRPRLEPRPLVRASHIATPAVFTGIHPHRLGRIVSVLPVSQTGRHPTCKPEGNHAREARQVPP